MIDVLLLILTLLMLYTGRKNLAIFRPVLMSQDVDEQKLTDGDTATCTETNPANKAAKEWIKVDLFKEYNIALVRIYNTNSLKTFIEGAKVLVDGSLCGTVGSMGTASFVDVHCSSTILGSVVVVYLTTSESVTKISACEIEVYEGIV